MCEREINGGYPNIFLTRREADDGASALRGRGPRLSPREAMGSGLPARSALKVAEILRVPALGYSAAELQHGPRAAIAPDTPVLLLRPNDETAATVDELISDLSAAGETVFSVGGPHGTLPWIGDDHPICDAMTMLIPAYAAVEAAARRLGLDPDNPPHLTKVTRTL